MRLKLLAAVLVAVSFAQAQEAPTPTENPAPVPFPTPNRDWVGEAMECKATLVNFNAALSECYAALEKEREKKAPRRRTRR